MSARRGRTPEVMPESNPVYGSPKRVSYCSAWSRVVVGGGSASPKNARCSFNFDAVREDQKLAKKECTTYLISSPYRYDITATLIKDRIRLGV